MPYVKPDDRAHLAFRPFDGVGSQCSTPGELNYVITMIADEYLNYGGVEGSKFGYTKINEVIGVLECAKLELYRRIAAPYEDKKIAENGDVYTCQK